MKYCNRKRIKKKKNEKPRKTLIEIHLSYIDSVIYIDHNETITLKTNAQKNL